MPNKKKTTKSSLKKRAKPVKSTVKKPAKTKKAKAAPSKKIRARVSQGQLPKRPADSNAAATDKSKKSSAGKSGADRKDGSAGKSGKPVVIHNAPTVSVSSKGGSVGDFDFSSRTKSTSKIKEWSGPNGLDYSVPEEPSRKAGRSSRADDDDGYDYPMGMAYPPAHYTLNFEPHIKPEFHANSYGTYNAKGSHVSKSSKTTKPTRVIVNKPAIRKYKPPEFKENKVGKSVLNFISPEQRQPVSVDIAPEPPLAPPAPPAPKPPAPVLERKQYPYSVRGRTAPTRRSADFVTLNESKEDEEMETDIPEGIDDLPIVVKEEGVKQEKPVAVFDPEVQSASGLHADLLGLTGRFKPVIPAGQLRAADKREFQKKKLSQYSAKRLKEQAEKTDRTKLVNQTRQAASQELALIPQNDRENPGDQSLAQALVPHVPLPMETNAVYIPTTTSHYARSHTDRLVGDLPQDGLYIVNSEHVKDTDYDKKTGDGIRTIHLHPNKRQVLEVK